MRHFILLLLPLFVGIMNVSAQEEQQADTTKVHLKGRVTDESQDPVALCQVRIEGQPFGTTASLDGRYSLSFSTADSVVVLYSMMGYETRRRVLKKPQGNLTLNIVMRESGKELSEVTVAETRRQLGSVQELNKKDLKRMPSTSGNAVEELVATQAGVSTHNELTLRHQRRHGRED